jgi:uncharacterized protein DUF4105
MLTIAVRILAWLVLLIMTGWGTLAVYYSNLSPAGRLGGGILFALGSLAVLLYVRPWRRAVAVFLACFALVVVWWLAIPPSNDRDWQPDVAVLPYATIDGDRVTIHNIRNIDYRSETDYTVRYYDRTFDLATLNRADGYLVYWGSPLIAHTMLSFGFDGNQYVCISIETRKSKGQEYSAIKGFFKQYELTYVVADERDVVRLRTNYRHEDVYLFHLNVKPDNIRKIFLDYLREVNELKEHPKWYNALTTNCTTDIRTHTVPYNPKARWDWRFIINGYLDEYLYKQGMIDQSLPLAELKRRSYINKKANAADGAADFSTRIRQGLPGT